MLRSTLVWMSPTVCWLLVRLLRRCHGRLAAARWPLCVRRDLTCSAVVRLRLRLIVCLR